MKHCLGILPEKKERETAARDSSSVFAGTICGQGPYDRPRDRFERYVNTESGKNYRVTYHREYESTSRIRERRLVMPCSRRRLRKIPRLLEIPISVCYHDLLAYLSSSNDIVDSETLMDPDRDTRGPPINRKKIKSDARDPREDPAPAIADLR